jgi:hypothetical protein
MKVNVYVKSLLGVIAICLVVVFVKHVFVATANARNQVAIRRIDSYRLGWNQRQNVGEVQIKPSFGPAFSFRVNSVADLAGWEAVLRGNPVLEDSNGWIYSGPE